MPKAVVVDPKKVRKKGAIKFKDILVNQYTSDYKKEVKKYGKAGLNNMMRDIRVIREFENMLNSIKTTNVYNGIEYNHAGPAHLGIGQESTFVGQAYNLDLDDQVFGSHRSHGEIIAKCFRAVELMSEDELQKVMESYFDGMILKIVEKHYDSKDIKDQAFNFVLYGTLAEVFGRETGVNRGMGGSMHAFFAPFGSMPNNAIVGGSGDISVGAALYKRINRKPGIVVANIGDASSACGPVWEGICVSAMDQYRTLWDKEVGGAPPILISFINNFYGMGGQPEGETMGFGMLARIGAGVNPDQMHAERVDGYNPLSVADAIERKKKILLKGQGPILLDTVTYRMSGHSPSDQSSYRSKEEMEMWEAQDCVKAFSDYLVSNKASTKKAQEEMQNWVEEKITQTCKLASDTSISPRLNCTVHLGEMMFSNEKIDKFDDREPEVLLSKKENPRVKMNARKSRSAYDENGKELVKARTIAFRDALFEAMLHRFYEDPTMVAFGEENRDWGGAFAVYRGLTEALPYHRLFNTPISEGAIVGAAVGYALAGGRVVPELMYCDFMGRSGDEVFNQLAKWQSMSANVLKMPVVLRVSVGSKYGAQHSQDWTSICSHIPGLKVYFPVTPYDGKGMLNTALHGSDPVIFFESQRLYDVPEYFAPDGVPEDYYEIEEGEPAVRRTGTDLTICTIGATLYRAIEAADELEAKHGISAEVIDLRFINPLNYDKILESVRKTGKVVLSSDACERGSFLHNVASNITNLAFDDLDAPPVVVGARNWITPPYEMEPEFFPQKEWILDAIHERILPLPGHEVSTYQTDGEMLMRNRRGI